METHQNQGGILIPVSGDHCRMSLTNNVIAVSQGPEESWCWVTQLIKLDLCLCMMPSLLIFLYLFQRDFTIEKDLHERRWFLKSFLNKNPCSFSKLLLSYLCASSICKWYHWNICALNGVPLTCRNSSLFSCCFILPGVRLCYVTVIFRNADAGLWFSPTEQDHWQGIYT